MNLDWYRDFFSGIVVDMWIAAIPADMTAREIDYIVSRLGLPAGARILDLACGHGRHALELAARGYRVTGADISTEFLDRARRAAAQRALNIDWHLGDMREPVPGAPFDAVVCLGNCSCYFPAAGTQALFSNIARSLRPGGRLILETGTVAESLLPHFKEGAQEMAFGNLTCHFDRRYEPLDSREDVTATFIQDGRRDTRHYAHHVYTAAQIVAMLAHAGLRIISAHGSTAGEDYRLGSQDLYLTASTT